MSIEISRNSKGSITLQTPVMPAAGTFSYGEVYRDLINLEKLGALVTSPVTYEPWTPANGTRVVPLESGVLVHTGLPNLGLNKVLKNYRNLWAAYPVPVILHLVATTVEQVRKSVARLDEEECIAGIELGLNDDVGINEAERLVKAATSMGEKPILVRLPMQDAYELAQAVADAGADTLVVCAPPRGTARDPKTGRLVSGRVYSPTVKPIVLRMVGQILRRVHGIPVIGAGGIHSPQDARDYLEAGACAVQVDSATWVQPTLLEFIARDLGGMTVTRPSGAFPDEWFPGMGDTERDKRARGESSNRD
ncbi:MAG: tRNA-dihydrouridine synthase [Armatimonadetes bacterium]|nr:tRNA-dihydrouridine synthase [Anaerolineae bacterium]